MVYPCLEIRRSCELEQRDVTIGEEGRRVILRSFRDQFREEIWPCASFLHRLRCKVQGHWIHTNNQRKIKKEKRNTHAHTHARKIKKEKRKKKHTHTQTKTRRKKKKKKQKKKKYDNCQEDRSFRGDKPLQLLRTFRKCRSRLCWEEGSGRRRMGC